MQLPDRLDAILTSLPPAWDEARLVLTVADDEQADRAALMLGPLSPGRTGRSFRFVVSKAGGDGPSPDAVERVLERLDAAGIDARLTLPGTASFRIAPESARKQHAGLAESFDAIVTKLPPDWSDLYLEVELASSDDLDRAALLLAPVNPLLHDGPRPILRFRTASSFGYGAAPQMTRRVLTRLDNEHIAGTLRLLREHADVRPAHTQGIVWREEGRSV
jgi:hypothetical protein